MLGMAQRSIGIGCGMSDADGQQADAFSAL